MLLLKTNPGTDILLLGGYKQHSEHQVIETLSYFDIGDPDQVEQQ